MSKNRFSKERGASDNKTLKLEVEIPIEELPRKRQGSKHRRNKGSHLKKLLMPHKQGTLKDVSLLNSPSVAEVATDDELGGSGTIKVQKSLLNKDSAYGSGTLKDENSNSFEPNQFATQLMEISNNEASEEMRVL